MHSVVQQHTMHSSSDETTNRGLRRVHSTCKERPRSYCTHPNLRRKQKETLLYDKPPFSPAHAAL